jgi:hypothetical protein
MFQICNFRMDGHEEELCIWPRLVQKDLLEKFHEAVLAGPQKCLRLRRDERDPFILL